MTIDTVFHADLVCEALFVLRGLGLETLCLLSLSALSFSMKFGIKGILGTGFGLIIYFCTFHSGER